MRKLFKERKPFKGGNNMRKYGMYFNHIFADLEVKGPDIFRQNL